MKAPEIKHLFAQTYQKIKEAIDELLLIRIL
jgi:hypothetical protein